MCIFSAPVVYSKQCLCNLTGIINDIVAVWKKYVRSLCIIK